MLTAQQEIENLAGYMGMCNDGRVSDEDMILAIHRTSERLLYSCYCSLNACCPKHRKHLTYCNC